MGKKKKKDKFQESPFDYMNGGRIRQIGDNLGLNRDDFVVDGGNGRTDRGRSFDKDAYRKAVVDRMNNDYDVRRTMEAASMSGKKNAKKFATNGFKNIDAVIKGQDLLKKYHKKYQGGGQFSSASDYAGLSHIMVQKDRNKHTASINESVDSKVEGLRNEFMEKLKAQQEQAEVAEPDVQTSDRLANARSQVSEVEDTNFDQQPVAPDQADQTGSVAQQMLSEYKKRIADQMKPVSHDGL